MVLYILADWISFLEIQRLQIEGSSSTVFAFNLITTATYSQPFSAFNFAIDNDQKALFQTAKGRFRFNIYISYLSPKRIRISILRLLAFIRMLLVCSRILPVCIRMLPVCCTRMYPHVSLCYSFITPCDTLVYLCSVLVKILVNGYGHSEEIAVIVHNNPFTFLYKEEENRAGHLFAKRKVGVSIAN